MIQHTPEIGESLKMSADIYDDGDGHHPSGFMAYTGDAVVVRKVMHRKGGERIYVSHPEVTNNAFLAYRHELVKAD